jgi:hypothetical protein
MSLSNKALLAAVGACIQAATPNDLFGFLVVVATMIPVLVHAFQLEGGESVNGKRLVDYVESAVHESTTKPGEYVPYRAGYFVATCTCGDAFYDDVPELAKAQLEKHVENTEGQSDSKWDGGSWQWK